MVAAMMILTSALWPTGWAAAAQEEKDVDAVEAAASGETGKDKMESSGRGYEWNKSPATATQHVPTLPPAQMVCDYGEGTYDPNSKMCANGMPTIPEYLMAGLMTKDGKGDAHQKEETKPTRSRPGRGRGGQRGSITKQGIDALSNGDKVPVNSNKATEDMDMEILDAQTDGPNKQQKVTSRSPIPEKLTKLHRARKIAGPRIPTFEELSAQWNSKKVVPPISIYSRERRVKRSGRGKGKSGMHQVFGKTNGGGGHLGKTGGMLGKAHGGIFRMQRNYLGKTYGRGMLGKTYRGMLGKTYKGGRLGKTYMRKKKYMYHMRKGKGKGKKGKGMT